MKMNINELRKLAGLPLVEGYDEDGDDEMSQAEKDLVKKADTDLAKKGIKVKDFDPDKDIARAAKKDKSGDDEDEPKKDAKPADKKPAPAAKKDDKPAAEEAAEKKARKARAENPNKKAAKIRAYLTSNPDIGRGAFTAHAVAEFGMTKAGANTYFYKFKAKKAVAEGYILVHPAAPGFVLAENGMMNQYQWVDGSSELEPMVFVTEAAAKKVARYMTDYKFQTPTIETFLMDDAE